MTALGHRATLAWVLHEISAGAPERDADPAFPHEPFRLLAAAGVLGMPVAEDGRRSASFAREWEVLRAVARADASVGRILDGHLNAVERVAALAPEPLRSAELEGVVQGGLLLGVWGADPIPGEGEPARLTEGGRAVDGVKTFCSGSTGLDRALVAVRGGGGEPGPPVVAYIDLSSGTEVDTTWYRGAGMRASESHRVEFRGAPVLAVLGGPGELTREPFFGRDAIRTAATWAGIADAAVEATLDVLAAKSAGREPGEIVSLAAGRMLAARGTIDRWMEHAAREADARPDTPMTALSIELRVAVAGACRQILDEAARATGSHPFATAAPLDRARRDLELFLLQHRLEPALARRGAQEVQGREARR